MSDAAFPFSIPINLFLGGSGPIPTRAQWVQRFPTSAGLSLIMLTTQNGVQAPGLYLYMGGQWLFVASYDMINDYIITGGTINVYFGLTASATPPAGSIVFHNGVQTSATTLTAGVNALWAAIVVNDPSSGGGGGSSYVLPVATDSVLGGVKQGANVTIGADGTISVAAAGTVTSVAMTIPSIMTVVGTPITGAGTLALGLATQAPAIVFAGPVTGANAVPTFRPLSATDIPALPYAPTANPTFTGTVAVPTVAGSTDSTTAAASTAFVQAVVTAKAYSLPIATASVLGGVKAGSGVTIAGDGTISASGSGSSLINPTIRNIATRCATLGFTNTALTSMFCRSGHINRGDVTTGFAPQWENRYATFAGEFTGYANYVLTAALEYPQGTYTRLTFGGLSSVTVPAGGTSQADPCAVVVPIGARFWIRSIVNCPSGIFTTNGPVTDINPLISGDQSLTSATAIATDYTVTVYPGAGQMTAWHPPVSVNALSSRPSVIVYGDSRCAGLKDGQGGTNGGYGGFGEITRSFDAVVAYCNVGAPTGQASGFVTAHTNRVSLAVNHTHIHLQYGINDINAGRTAAQLETDLTTIVGYFPGKKVTANTIPPQCTGTTFLTQSDQTVFAAFAVRDTHNGWLRGTTHPFATVFDIADVLEYHRSGKWLSPDVDPRVPVSITFEGTHESPWGYLFLQKSGAVDGRVYLQG